jgi:hypothetical protein
MVPMLLNTGKGTALRLHGNECMAVLTRLLAPWDSDDSEKDQYDPMDQGRDDQVAMLSSSLDACIDREDAET